MPSVAPGSVDERVSQAWNTVAPSSRPGMTIRGTSTKSSSGKSQLVVRPRHVRDSRTLTGTTRGVGAPGDIEADYELLEILGEGGMGVVYAARQASIDRTVAVKMLKPDMASDAQLRSKFLTEAAVTGDLDHPNIVAIHELGSNEMGALFYSMRRVRGKPWLDLLKEKTLSENLEIFMRLADAVAFSHSKGVIHRDLKPENVMLGDFGEVLLMDWGLALSVWEDGKAESIFDSDCLAGTPAYMGPEMALGPVSALGFTSDVYLLGAILYEVVTGSPPHAGESATECLYAVGRNIIEPTDKKGELVDIAMKAMETDPKNRYQTVQELQSAVKLYQSHSESLALSGRAQEDLDRAKNTLDYDDFAQAVFGFKEAFSLWSGNDAARRGASESRLLYAQRAMEKDDLDLAVSLLDPADPDHTGMLKKLKAARKERDARARRLKVITYTVRGLVAAFIAVLAVGSYWINNERSAALKAKEEADSARQLAEKSEKVAVKERENAIKQKKQAEIEKQKAVEEKKKADAATLEAQRQKETAEKERSKAEVAKKQAEDAAEVARKAEDKAKKAKTKVDREAYYALIGVTDKSILENSHGRARDNLRSCMEELRKWEWGRLMYECNLHLEALVYPKGDKINSVAYMPDGHFAITAAWDGVRIWDATPPVADTPIEKTAPILWKVDGRPQESLEAGNVVRHVSVSPDGKLVLTVTLGSPKPVKLWYLDFENGTASYREPAADGMHVGDVLYAQFSPDGKYFITCGQDRTARLWLTATGEHLFTFPRHGDPVTCVAFSDTDLTQIATGSQDASAHVFQRNVSNDKLVEAARTWKAHEQAGGERANAPPAPFIRKFIFRGHSRPINAIAYSPDGKRVVTGSDDNTAMIWVPADERPFDFGELRRKQDVLDAPDATQLPRRIVLAGHTAPVRSVTFSKDGKYVLTASDDNTSLLWYAQDVDVVRTLSGTAYLHPNGEIEQSRVRNDFVKVWGKPYMPIKGHGSAVQSATFSPDGRYILTGSYDGAAKIWDKAHYIAGKRVIDTAQSGVMSGGFGARGKYIVTAGRDGSANIYDPYTGDLKHTLSEGHQYLVTTVAMSRDGQRALTDARVVTGAQDKSVRVWDNDTGTEILHIRDTGRSGAAAISAAGDFVVTGMNEPGFMVWDVDKKQKRDFKFEAERALISVVTISPDDRYIATGDEEGRVFLWDSATGMQVASLRGHRRRINALAFSPDGSFLMSAGADRLVRGWAIPSGEEKPKLSLRLTDSMNRVQAVSALAITQDSILTGTNEGHLVAWTLDGKQQLLLDTNEEVKVRVTAVDFSPNGKFALAVTSDDKVRLWQRVDDKWEFLTMGPEQGAVWTARFSPRGDQLLTGGGRDAQVWDLSNPAAIRFIRNFAPQGVLSAANFSHQQSEYVLTASWDGTVKIWDVQKGLAVGKLTTDHTGRITSAQFSPDNKLILTTSEDGTARLWEKADEGWTFTRRGQPMTHDAAIAMGSFSPDGSLIVTASMDRTAMIWSAATGEPQGNPLQGHAGGVLSATFSADSRFVVTTSQDNTAKVWSLENRDADPRTLTGHTAFVTSAVFSPDGLRLITSSDDTTVRVWDVSDNNSRPVLTLRGHSQRVTSASFSPDGRTLLTTSADGTAVVWPTSDWRDAALAKQPEAAKEVASR